MQSVDLLITDIDWLLTVDAERRIIRDAAIAVNEGRIAAVGKSVELVKAFAGKRKVDGRRTVATPGFIDPQRRQGGTTGWCSCAGRSCRMG